MKKVIVSILFCSGVGLALMADPAQVFDDDSSNTVSSRVSDEKSTRGIVSEEPLAPIAKERGLIKFETHKTIDPSWLNTPKLLFQHSSSTMVQTKRDERVSLRLSKERSTLIQAETTSETQAESITEATVNDLPKSQIKKKPIIDDPINDPEMPHTNGRSGGHKLRTDK